MSLAKILLAAAAAGLPLLSAASMRCGKNLVHEGDNFDKVRRTCGEADATYAMGERYVYRSIRNTVEAAAVADTVKVDMWVYRGSNNELTRNLYFENGILVEIELGERR